MQKSTRVVSAALSLWLAVLLSPNAANAGSYEEFNAGLAAFNHGQVDIALTHFSASLEPGDLPAYMVPIAYYDRAILYASKKDAAGALADFQGAIKAKPDFADAYIDAAQILYAEKKYDDALSTLTQAKAQNPNVPRVYELSLNYELAQGKPDEAIADRKALTAVFPTVSSYRSQLGKLEWQLGRYQDAKADLEATRQMNAGDTYAVVWIWLTIFKLGAEPSDADKLTLANPPKAWPGPVLQLFGGATTPDDVLTAAATGNATTAPGRQCEANFYVAEWYLRQHDTAKAQDLLQKEQAVCPASYVEVDVTKTELKALQ